MPSRNTANETDRELAAEQEYLTSLHAEADALREHAAARLAAADRTTAPFWRAELDRLDAAADGLCFGRLDLRDGGRTYIGRLGLFRDDEPLLLDWRAPAARPFYTATLSTPHGVRRRRRITTRGRVVLALDDELLDTEAGDDDVLVGGAALLAALTARRTGRMPDIVTTASDRERNQRIRAWANANGFEVSERGRLASEVAAAYERAHGAEAESPAPSPRKRAPRRKFAA